MGKLGLLCVSNISGIGAGCRRLEQYEDEELSHMISVGSAPSGGNRSLVSELLSYVDREIKKRVLSVFIFDFFTCISILAQN